jgi:hypothetical protein
VIKPRMNVDANGTQRLATFLTASEAWVLDRLMRAKYFLFRNDGGQYGERLVCRQQNPDGSWRGCGNKHLYLTCMCVEMPFRGGSGLEEGLYLSFRAATDEVRQHQIIKAISKLPDLASGHPLTARDMHPDDPGENWLAVLLSYPEPITRQQAEKFAARINERHPPAFFDLGPP